MQIVLNNPSTLEAGRQGPKVQALTGLYCETLVFKDSWSCDSVVVLPIPQHCKHKKEFKTQEKYSEWFRNIRRSC